MNHSTQPAPNSANPYEPAVVPSGDQFGNNYVRFSSSFRFAIVLTGGLFLAVLFTRIRFEEIFIGFGLVLPFPTIVALNPGTLAAIFTLFLFTFAKEFIYPAGGFALVANRLVCLAALVIGLAYVTAVFLPFITTLAALD